MVSNCIICFLDKDSQRRNRQLGKTASISTGSSAISTRVIENIIAKLKLNRNRDSTKKNYYCVWRNFNEFFVRLDTKPQTWEDRIVLYAGYLIDQGKKSTTVKSYISAIKAVLLDDGVQLCEDKFLLSSITKACRLVSDHIRTRLPIQKGLLKLILKRN